MVIVDELVFALMGLRVQVMDVSRLFDVLFFSLLLIDINYNYLFQRQTIQKNKVKNARGHL